MGEQRGDLGPGARLVEVALAERGQAGIPVPLKRIEPLGGHRIGAAVVVAENGGGAGEERLVAGFHGHDMVGSAGGPVVRWPRRSPRRTSGPGRGAAQRQGLAGLDREVAVEHGAEERIGDGHGDELVGAERLDHAHGSGKAAVGDGQVLRPDAELQARRRPAARRSSVPATCQWPSLRLAGRKFIGGLPMKPPTKASAGSR